MLILVFKMMEKQKAGSGQSTNQSEFYFPFKFLIPISNLKNEKSMNQFIMKSPFLYRLKAANLTDQSLLVSL
jgi:hypothetical protein